jgi:hypothetical protein
MTDNIITCRRCRHKYIWEEFDNHVCNTLKTVIFVTEGHFMCSYDGKHFFRLPAPTESRQRNKTTDDPTEHKFIIQDMVL